MKNLVYLTFTLLLMSFSCEDDDGDSLVILDPALEADWNMTQYVFFGPEAPEFKPGDVVWTFNNQQQKLTIVNRLEDQYPYLPQSGEYIYFNNNGLMEIQGLDLELYQYEIKNEGTILTLMYEDDPEIADDELFIQFETE